MADVKVFKWVKVGGKKIGLVNQHKVDEAIANARLGQDDIYQFPATNQPSDELIAVLYDKHGGLILNAKGETVETGTFFDFTKKTHKVDISGKKSKKTKDDNSDDEETEEEPKTGSNKKSKAKSTRKTGSNKKSKAKSTRKPRNKK